MYDGITEQRDEPKCGACMCFEGCWFEGHRDIGYCSHYGEFVFTDNEACEDAECY